MAFKNSNRKSNTISLKEGIQDLLKSYHLEEKYITSSIRQKWDDLMGSAIAHRTVGMSLKNKILTVKLSSAPLKNELNLSKSKLIEMLNKSYGDKVIEDIHFM